MKSMSEKNQEVKLEKGAASAIFDGFNDNIKPKRVNANGTKKKTGKAPKKK